MFAKLKYLLLLTVVISQSAWAGSDPFEGYNRKVFAFNDWFDGHLLQPVAKGYNYAVPGPLNKGISNFFSNIDDVNVVVNDLLQLKLRQAGSDTGRVLVNTTVGVVGLIDVATDLGLPKHHEDFGQTLGYWGFGSGAYIVLPFLGSSNVRDGLGSIANSQLDGVMQINEVPTRNSLYSLRTLDNRAELLSAEKLIRGDRYTFIRDLYLQRREYLVNDGMVEDDF